MAANIRDLKVWQEAVALGAEVVRCAKQGARRETKVVTDQLMLCALAAEKLPRIPSRATTKAAANHCNLRGS